ncbi:hypothetical protein A2U01_0102257, partial [Trifolium medium]|nr:hypothetical protein [Trifolium medium]
NYRNRLRRTPGRIILGSRMSRGTLFRYTRNTGMTFPRICSRRLVPPRIGRFASPTFPSGSAPRGAGALSQCTR